jgi:hypothetical protein
MFGGELYTEYDILCQAFLQPSAQSGGHPAILLLPTSVYIEDRALSHRGRIG